MTVPIYPLDIVLTAADAAEKWQLAANTVRNACLAGRFAADEAKKSGGTWLVTISGMEKLYGPRPNGN